MKLTIQDVAQAGPIYQQVKNSIESLIGQQQLKSGQILPRAAEIARNNGIPEAEVVRAYHELVLGGVLSKTQRKNLFGEPVSEHTVK
jgi:DNA-binding transcriptional regulator YhcF (GntR family)